jgi:hypothetical protein
MNGEPRDAANASIDVARPTSSGEVAERTPVLPRVINAEGVSRTTARNEVDRDLPALFTPDATGALRARWDLVQGSFVDDPRQAVKSADELVVQVTKDLADTFASQRLKLEKGLDEAGEPTTENLRVALRQYRAFFERLLSI